MMSAPHNQGIHEIKETCAWPLHGPTEHNQGAEKCYKAITCNCCNLERRDGPTSLYKDIQTLC